MSAAKERKKRNVRLIWIILIIIVAVGVIVTINLSNNKKDAKPAQQQSQVENGQQEEEKPVEKYVQVLEDGTKLNISEKIKQTKKVGDLEISNIQITYQNGVTNILATVTNTSSKKSELQNVSIVLSDDEGNTIYTLRGVLEETEPNGTSQLNTSITADFANSYDFTISKTK